MDGCSLAPTFTLSYTVAVSVAVAVDAVADVAAVAAAAAAAAATDVYSFEAFFKSHNGKQRNNKSFP